MTNLRSALIGLLSIICFAQDCHSKTFYMGDYDENRVGEIYPISSGSGGIKSSGGETDPPKSDAPVLLSDLVKVPREEQRMPLGRWSAVPETFPSPLDYQSQQHGISRGLDDIGANRFFPLAHSFGVYGDYNNNHKRSPFRPTSKQSRYFNFRGRAPSEGYRKRQSILYSQCFFNPISCF